MMREPPRLIPRPRGGIPNPDRDPALIAALEALVVDLEGPSAAWMKVPDAVLADRCRIANRIDAILRQHRERRGARS